MTIGEKIKLLRKQQRLTLSDLSKKVGISISFLSDIENSRSNPSLSRLQSVARALGTTVSSLLGEKEESLDFSNVPLDIRELIINNSHDPIFIKILSSIRDFNSWSTDDKNELLSYLKVKEDLRKKSEN